MRAIRQSNNNVSELIYGELIVNIIKYELKESNKTIVIIEKIIDEICSKLEDKSKQKECYEIVNDIDFIKNLILKGLDPKDICVDIGFCNNNTKLF